MTELDLDLDLRFGDEVMTTSTGQPTGELTIDLGEGVYYDIDADAEGEIILHFWEEGEP